MNVVNYNIPILWILIGGSFIFVFLLYLATSLKPKVKINMSKIDRMTGVEFEEHFAKILSDNGFKFINKTPTSGDYGIDLLCNKSGSKYAMQLKRYKGKVGVAAVQEAVSGTIYYKAKIPCVVTNSYYTAQAIKMAKECKVILIDRNNFINNEFSFKCNTK